MSLSEGRLVHARVFLSYAHEDRVIVSRLVQHLTDSGIDVWIDERAMVVGESIRAAVERAIEDHDIFMVALSPHSVASRWVLEELDMIHNRVVADNAALLPVVVAECDVPLSLRGSLLADLQHDYTRGLALVVDALQKAGWARTDRQLAAKMRDVEQATLSARERSNRYAEIGSMAMALGRFAEAVAAFDASISASRRNWDAHQLRAGSLIKLKRFKEAEAGLTALLEAGIQRGRSAYNLACLYSRWAEAASSQAIRKRYLDRCLEQLSAAITMGLVSWLRRNAQRADPIRDIVTDPDLRFARQVRPDVDARLADLERRRRRPRQSPRYTYGGGGGGCMRPGTGVLCADGRTIPIDDVRCGDWLASARAIGRGVAAVVCRTLRTWESQGVTLNGRLTVTARQPVRTAQGWKPAAALVVGDSVSTSEGAWERIRSVERWVGLREVRHLHLERRHVFYAEGIMLHNVKRY